MECRNCIFRKQNLIKDTCKITEKEIRYSVYGTCDAPTKELNKILMTINYEKMRRSLSKSSEIEERK